VSKQWFTVAIDLTHT